MRSFFRDNGRASLAFPFPSTRTYPEPFYKVKNIIRVTKGREMKRKRQQKALGWTGSGCIKGDSFQLPTVETRGPGSRYFVN